MSKYNHVYLVMEEDELLFASVDEESAEAYVEDIAYKQRQAILDEWGIDDPSVKDLVEAESQLELPTIVGADISGLSDDDEITVGDEVTVCVSDIIALLEADDEEDELDEEDEDEYFDDDGEDFDDDEDL